jgi:uncharacterized protein
MHVWWSIRTCLLRLLLALVAIAASAALFRFGVLALIEPWLTPESGVIAVVRPPGTIVSALLGYWLFVRYFEERAATELAFRPLAMAVAASSGALLILVTILVLFATGYYELQYYRGFAGVPRVLGYIGIAAIFEELLFRVVLFRLLEQQMGTIVALSIQSLIFGALHLFNPEITVMTALSVTLLGACWAMVFIYSRNLWVVSCNHAAWNAVIFLSGIPLSGTQDWSASAPIESHYQGSVWMTGGGFGPEDSIINVLLMMVVFGGMTHFAIRRKLIISAPLMRSGRQLWRGQDGIR